MKAKFLQQDKNSCFNLIQDETTNQVMIALKNQLATKKKFKDATAAIKFINGKNIPWELILNLIVMIIKEILENMKEKEKNEKESTE